MKVGLITDAIRPNLALMKLSTYHKAKGNNIVLNDFTEGPELTYGSWLWDVKYPCTIQGGPAFNPTVRLPPEVEAMRPDYNLYPNIDYSIGYTWSYCPRQCGFCIVPKQDNPKEHRSIWTFHDSRFKKICLLNNNTLSDPHWKETFAEINEAKLTVHDENGYDVRLLTEAKAEVLKATKFDTQIHFAWDLMEDEESIIKGLRIAKTYCLDAMVYVLMGFDTTFEEDIYRCEVIHSRFHFDPFPMLYKITPQLRTFRRMIYLRYYRKYKSIKEAWNAYK